MMSVALITYRDTKDTHKGKVTFMGDKRRQRTLSTQCNVQVMHCGNIYIKLIILLTNVTPINSIKNTRETNIILFYMPLAGK